MWQAIQTGLLKKYDLIKNEFEFYTFQYNVITKKTYNFIEKLI